MKTVKINSMIASALLVLICTLFFFSNTKAIANDCDIRKITGISLGDDFETVEEWIAKNNYKWDTDIITKNDGTKARRIYMLSLPVNYYHFQSFMIDFDENNRVNYLWIALDSNYFEHPKSIRALLDTLKIQANNFEENKEIHLLTLFFDNCTIVMKTKLNANDNFFLINFRRPE